MIEYKLKEPLSIYNKESGDYKKADTVIVEFKGKKGLMSLLRLREKVYAIIRESSKGASSSAADDGDEIDSSKKMKVSDLAAFITTSEGAFDLFCSVMEQLHYFAKVDGQLLKEAYQEDMCSDDLQGLYTQVIKSFLLSDVCQQVNSLNK